jgi:hypothetical protein
VRSREARDAQTVAIMQAVLSVAACVLLAAALLWLAGRVTTVPDDVGAALFVVAFLGGLVLAARRLRAVR